MTGAGFTVWVTGPEMGPVQAIAEQIAAGIAARAWPVEPLGASTPGIEVLAGEGGEQRVAFVAAALARHGVATVVSLPAAARAARERARTELGRMVEVYVRPAAGAAAPDYEPPDRPEVEITVPEAVPGAGAEQVLRTLEVLDMLPRREDRAYSEAEEREVIRRLKAFGYL